MKASANNTVLSCEHGGNRIPAAYKYLFSGQEKVLQSHRGWDPGALLCARKLSLNLGVPLLYGTTSRLLIDLNRSLHHHNLFSEFTRPLEENDRQAVIRNVYLPYRERLREVIAGRIRRLGFALHLSIHSFTPVLDNAVRNADIGLLYDPRRPREAGFARRLQNCLRSLDSTLRIRRNYPSRGSADGATTQLRKIFSDHRYAGLELEINQKYPLTGDRKNWLRLQNTILQALGLALGLER